MSMGIGTNTQNPDEGELKRDLEKIAAVSGLQAPDPSCQNWSSTRMMKVCFIRSVRSMY